jgi:predicted metal-binding membrane protein
VHGPQVWERDLISDDFSEMESPTWQTVTLETGFLCSIVCQVGLTNGVRYERGDLLGIAVPLGRGSVTVRGSTMSLQREHPLFLALLLILAATSWVILIWQSSMMKSMGMGLTMGMGATLFLAIWVVMMIAMMFPTTAPMNLVFARVQRERHSGRRPSVATWIFVGAYLLIWTLFGGLLYLGARASSGLAGQVPWIMLNAARIGGSIFMLAGLYQFTPLKRVCLAKCCTPLDFILGAWRSGYTGAFRMGLEHGIYCLGSNWLLFVLLFPLGIMNIAVMAVLTVLICAEKMFPRGERIALVVGLTLIFYGILVIVVPTLLSQSPAGM